MSQRVVLGDLEIGVRADDADVAALLGELLELHDIETDDEPTGYSIVSKPPETAVGRPLPTVQRGPQVIFRSRSTRRLAAALHHHVHSHGELAAGQLNLPLTAVMGEGKVVLAPTWSVTVPGIEPRFGKAGLAVMDAPSVRIDMDTGSVSGVWWDATTDTARRATAPIVGVILSQTELFGAHDSIAGRVAAVTRTVQCAPGADPQQVLEVVTDAVLAGDHLLQENGPTDVLRAITTALQA